MSAAPARTGQALSRRLVRGARDAYLAVLDARDRLLGRADELTPPRALHFVGGGDFRAIGAAFLGHFRALGGLRPEHAVLDIGCGTGRMAVPLLGFLSPAGAYTGFDLTRAAIDWCAARITARNPRFRFVHADIYNLEYNPAGAADAAGYAFPCADASVDFAFATSVFTHIHGPETRNYLAQLARVLKPGGRALLTFFLKPQAAVPADRPQFAHRAGEGWTIDPVTPERAIAYDETWLRAQAQAAGLAVDEPVRYGAWSGRADPFDYQDIVMLRRPGAA